jgi:tetratricopeptide (TPR) repeat protein
LVFGAFLLCATASGEQTALSHSEVILVKTCLGTAAPASSPVEPSTNIAIAVFADTLREEELAQVRQEISSFYQASRLTSLRVAAIYGSEIQFAGQFRTRALLQAGLAELLKAPPGASGVVPLRFYTYLGNVASQFGSGWSSLVVVGRFPATDGELTGFTEAWLATQFRAARLRVSYWTPSGEDSEILNAVAPATGGSRLAEGMAGLVPVPKAGGDFREISWPDPRPAAGFRLCPLTLVGSNGQTVMTIPSIAVASGAIMPELERYALFREKTKSLEGALVQSQLSAEQAKQAEADLNVALEIGQRKEETLRLGAGFYKRSGNDGKLSGLLDVLAGVAQDEPGLFTDLGHSRYRMKDWEAAEKALLRARELKPGDGLVAEELARIRLTRQDDRGALPFLEESLAANAGNQELWLLRADLAARLNDWQRTADSVEHAIGLGGVPVTRRTALVRLYIEHQMPDRALVHVRAVEENLPADSTVRTEYAGFLDQLQQPDEALAAWKRTLEVDSKLEPAHYRVTRLLIEKGSLDPALAASEAGIESAPQSARLYLAKAEVLEKKDRYYEARRTLRQISAKLPDASLLERLAEMEDAGGEHAARYYRKLVETGSQAPALLTHGLEAALRDGDQEDAAWFQARQNAGGAAGTPRARGGTVSIPGGLAALSFVARSRLSSPERFLVEYARTSARSLQIVDKKAAEAYTESIREHFHRIAELTALGTGKAGQVTVTIAAQDKKNQKSAEKVLALLGWKIRTGRQGVTLEPAEKGARARHQETASALAIDEVGMQEALEAGKPFSCEIPTESASVVLGEEIWRNQFYAKEKYPGGLAEAIASDQRLAETYAALGQMDANTAAVLVSAVPLKTLSEKYALMLLQYSSALAVERGRATVPGGDAAETIWTNLAGANPRQPGPFFRALLAKQDGKLLAYYSALSELDIQHQRFFTRTASRTSKFYELFKDAPETQRSRSRHIQSGTFVEFLSEVPLDTDGSVDFPGSPEVWMVAKGQSRSTGNVAKMMKKVKRAVAPDVEDEILLRLAGTRYKENKNERSELDNFLAVMRIDDHRSDPLDETSALLLAQHYAEDGAAYPFFATLTGLGEKQFTQFFTLAEEWRGASEAEKNMRLATLNALVKILCLAQQAGTLDEAQAATLFGKVMDGLQRAASPAARTAASLDLVREILAATKNAGASPDEGVRNLLLGPTDAGRQAAFSQVLEMQKVPSLAAVMALADATRSLALGKGSAAAEIQVLETKSSGLAAGEGSKELGLKGKERQAVEGFQARRIPEIVKQFREKTARKKVNPKDLEKLAQDYLEVIDAPVRWALEGVIYAYFLSPDDLLVSEDPLLLRKHQFVPLASGQKAAHLFKPADLTQSSEKAGSYFTGGFADFGDAAGLAAALSSKLGGDTGGVVAAKQIAALRSTHWEQLRDEDLRLLGLKVTVAREWIVRSASQPELAAGLAESALGLLSLTRRADLLGALADGNWSSVWSLVTLSDLYFLGDRYLARYAKDSWQSPATAALRRAVERDDGARLQWLGAEFDDTFGCSHPHLQSAPPYEEYEKDLFPTRLAERTAEFKLYLARYADTAGMSAADLGTMAEPAARAILKKMQLTDLHDWRSALAAFAAFHGTSAKEALAKP